MSPFRVDSSIPGDVTHSGTTRLKGMCDLTAHFDHNSQRMQAERDRNAKKIGEGDAFSFAEKRLSLRAKRRNLWWDGRLAVGMDILDCLKILPSPKSCHNCW